MNGAQMAREMAEQPERLRRLIGRFDAIVERVRALALYGVEVDYSGQLVIAVSQSGVTPEIVTTLHALRDAGGRGLAITNDLESALAKTAAATVDLEMGEERAVPATKTVTGQLTAFAIITSALGRRVPFTRGQLDALPRWVQAVLDDQAPVAAVAEALVGTSRLVIVARGYLFAAARETALKLKETCSMFADGYSGADLRHGPIAAVTRGLPVVALCGSGPALADVASLIDEVRARHARVARSAARWSRTAARAEHAQAVARAHQIAAHVLDHAHQVTEVLIGDGWHQGEGEFAGGQEAREADRVSAIGLDAVTDALGIEPGAATRTSRPRSAEALARPKPVVPAS